MERLADSAVYEQLPPNAAARRERLLSFFGQDLIGFRNDALKQVYQQLERTSWDGLLPYDQHFFSQAAESLSPEQRELSRKLTERTITIMMGRLMTMLSAAAPNQPLGRAHGLRYHLTVDVESCPRESPTERYRRQLKEENLELADFSPPDAPAEDDAPAGTVLETHNLTEECELHFPNYWHRWLNRYGNY